MVKKTAVTGASSPEMPERVGAATAPATKPTKSTRRGRDKVSHTDPRGRTTRDQDEPRSELFERVDEDIDYVRPTSTQAPKEMPGMKQRWIRVGLGNTIDEKNLTRKLREGWRARPSSTVPKGFHVPRITHGRFAGTIMVEGLLLCHMPLKLARKRAEAMRELTRIRTDAVNENLMRVNEGARGGFGPIKKGDRSELKPTKPRPGAKAPVEAVEEEVDLT